MNDRLYLKKIFNSIKKEENYEKEKLEFELLKKKIKTFYFIKIIIPVATIIFSLFAVFFTDFLENNIPKLRSENRYLNKKNAELINSKNLLLHSIDSLSHSVDSLTNLNNSLFRDYNILRNNYRRLDQKINILPLHENIRLIKKNRKSLNLNNEAFLDLIDKLKNEAGKYQDSVIYYAKEETDITIRYYYFYALYISTLNKNWTDSIIKNLREITKVNSSIINLFKDFKIYTQDEKKEIRSIFVNYIKLHPKEEETQLVPEIASSCELNGYIEPDLYFDLIIYIQNVLFETDSLYNLYGGQPNNCNLHKYLRYININAYYSTMTKLYLKFPKIFNDFTSEKCFVAKGYKKAPNFPEIVPNGLPREMHNNLDQWTNWYNTNKSYVDTWTEKNLSQLRIKYKGKNTLDFKDGFCPF